ncbi:MAG: hypothetical protein D6742_16935 [Cyanobacteria bacterium J069]|nr:MAG: hypothetical protein D6742_16935 [Cyanobacteria bacterium J069]
MTACSSISGPGRDIVERAIALQFSQTQEDLIQLLNPRDPKFPPFTISNVKITDEEGLKIDNLNGFRVRGTYDVTLEFPGRDVAQKSNPFEIYLQRQIEGKTWRLARRQSSASSKSDAETWVTQLVL